MATLLCGGATAAAALMSAGTMLFEGDEADLDACPGAGADTPTVVRLGKSPMPAPRDAVPRSLTVWERPVPRHLLRDILRHLGDKGEVWIAADAEIARHFEDREAGASTAR